jgi:radical SAM superfamily enzyme YgiQ (UPF0313 family)
MNILFVRPKPESETIGLQHVMIVEPLELEVLATLVKDEHNCTIIDLILEKKPFMYFVQKCNPAVICFTGYITSVNTIKEYARQVKEYDSAIITIAGGVHCEVCPEDLADRYLDFRVTRNATTNFPALIAHLNQQGSLPPSVLRAGEDDKTTGREPFNFYFPLPDRSFTARYRKHYFYIFHNKVALLKTAFGCPYRCEFCFCRKITADRFACRELEAVIEELAQLKEPNIYIVDDDFFSSRHRVLQFIGQCRKRCIKKKYLLYGRADFIVANEDIIREFAVLGLKTVIIGMESFFDAELARYNKKSESSNNEIALQILNKYKIDCYPTIIVSPSWGKAEFAYITQKLKTIGVQYVNLQPLTPLPGTDLKTDRTALILKQDEYEKWDLAHVSLKPEKLSIPDFYREMITVYEKVLFQPKFLLKYLVRYTPGMLYKMLRGSYLVKKQYLEKIKHAEAEDSLTKGRGPHA